MDVFTEAIDRHFPATGIPDKHELVRFDGYDQLEKESALQTFTGKSREDVLACIGRGELGWRNTALEEWCCLEPAAMRYYVKPYLQALTFELTEPYPDVNFVAAVFFALDQAAQVVGGMTFDSHQRALLLALCDHVIDVVLNDEQGRFDIGGEHIIDNVQSAQRALTIDRV